jgi:hypothetical protein
MSVLSTIVVDVEKFLKGTGSDAEKFAVAFVKYLKKVPAAEQQLDNFLSEAGVVVEAAVALVDPVAEAPVAGAFAIVETGLAAIGAAASAATSGNSLLVNLQNFAASVPQLLTGLTIKDPVLQAQVTKIVNLIVNETKVLLPAIEAWVAQIKASSTPAA